MNVQPHIVMALLEIRDRELRERAHRAAQHAATTRQRGARVNEGRPAAPPLATRAPAPAGC